MMKIIKAEKTDIEQLSALLAEGFCSDPLYCHYIPYEEERQGILLQIFRKYLSDFWEDLSVYTTADRAAVLCACSHTAQGMDHITLPVDVQKVYDRISSGVIDQFYSEYLLLDLLAVAPQMRGKGLAKTLVEEFCREAKARQLPGVVEIYEPANVEFYKKLGFRLAHIQPVGEILSAYLLEI